MPKYFMTGTVASLPKGVLIAFVPLATPPIST